MNTMKKWVVAGLIGLFSAGVSTAAPTLTDDFSQGGAGYVGGVLTFDAYGDRYVNTSLPANSVVSFPPDPSVEEVFRWSEVTSDPGSISVGAGGLTSSAGTDFVLTYWMGTLIDADPPNGAWYTTADFIKSYSGFTLDFGTVNLGANGSIMAGFEGGMVFIDLTSLAVDDAVVYVDFATAKWTDDIYYGDSQHTLYQIADNAWQPGGAQYNSGADHTFRIWVTADGGTVNINSYTLNGQDGVPEPETVWMMLAVLGSLAVTFRGQLSDLARRFVKS